MRTGIDKGFCVRWGRLSYRRKFIRTLWGGPIMLVLLILIVPQEYTFLGIKRDYIAIICTIGFFHQAISNYKRWKKEKEAKDKVSEALRKGSLKRKKEDTNDQTIRSFEELKVSDVFPNVQNNEYRKNS